jgi:hypothetical protein
MKMKATIEKQVILTFSLPGVNAQSVNKYANESQLQQRSEETWTLKVNEKNVSETAQRLREVVAELERFATEELRR